MSSNFLKKINIIPETMLLFHFCNKL